MSPTVRKPLSKKDFIYCVQFVLFRFAVQNSFSDAMGAATGLRDAIALSYEEHNQTLPLGVRAHSSRGVPSSKALARGVPLQQVCDVAGWSFPNTFCSLDVHELESTSQNHVWDLLMLMKHNIECSFW